MHTLPQVPPLAPQQRPAPAASLPRIPVIDIGPLLQASRVSPSSCSRVAAQLDEACSTIGFFYVKNHGLPDALCEAVRADARRWFALPAEAKATLALSPATHYRGYQALGANATRYEGGFQRDWHEAVDYYRECDPESQAGLRPSPLHGRNRWPVQHPDAVQRLEAYFAACLHLGQRLMQGIALGLGLPPERFEEAGAGGTTQVTSYWVGRVIHYPPLAQGSAAAQTLEQAVQAPGEVDRRVQLSCGEHSDYGLLTLVNQDAHVSALQVKTASGAWLWAHPLPGTLVCNVGDMMEVWTNGRYTPTRHRVVNADPTRSRISIPFFYEPAFEALVQPLPELPGPPKYEPVRYGSHLESKVLTNFEL